MIAGDLENTIHIDHYSRQIAVVTAVLEITELIMIVTKRTTGEGSRRNGKSHQVGEETTEVINISHMTRIAVCLQIEEMNIAEVNPHMTGTDTVPDIVGVTQVGGHLAPGRICNSLHLG